LRPSQFAIFAAHGEKTLAFNTLTQTLLAIDLAYDEFERRLEAGALPADVAAELTRRRLLADGDDKSFDQFVLEFRQRRYGPQALVMYVTPSLKCNAACEYCFQRDIRPGLPRQSGPHLRDLIDFVAAKLPDATGVKITWFGGEPLLSPDYIGPRPTTSSASRSSPASRTGRRWSPTACC